MYRRSWEVELLLSGAVLVALIQLPGVVDRVYDRMDPQLADSWRLPLFMGYYYIKLILYTLVAGFLIHLCARAYWVAMIGLGTAFPAGIQWDRATLGPNAERVYREMLPTNRALIAAADRFSSTTFAGSLLIVMLFLVSIVIAVGAGGAALLVTTIAPAVSGDVVFWTVFLLFALVAPLAVSLDRKYGARWPADSLAARGVRWLVRWFMRVTLAPVHGTATMTLSTNVRRRWLWSVGAVIGVALIGLFLVKDVLIRRGVLTGDSYVHFPDAAPDGLLVDAAHYESMRRPGTPYTATPSLPDPVVDGPYLRLFVPVTARRANEAIGLQCADAPRFHDAGIRTRDSDLPDAERVRSVIDCLAGILSVELDGSAIDADFRLHEDPAAGVRGLVAFVPVQDLAPGAHTLRVARWPRADADEPAPPHHIPFWR